MKLIRFLLLLFTTCVISHAANPTFESFDLLYFRTNAPPPARIQTRMNTNQFRAPILPGDVWTLTNISGVYGGSTNITTNSIWGIDGSGHIAPIVTNNAVIATNIVRAGHGVNTGSETWQTKSIVLTNGVNYLPVADWSQLQLISPSSDPSLVQIVLSNGWNTVQHLEIFNLTNAVPSQGAFTLTNLTPIPDSLGGGVVKLINNENWVATNGCGIELRFISPDWVEQFRSDVSGNPTFISNTFNNITVISNTTLRGRITINNVSITTNTLWTTNTVAGSVNLKPVDDLVAVSTPNALFVGKNSLLLYGGTSGTDDIISYKSDTNGATAHTIKFDSQQDGAPPHGVWTLNVDTNGSSILTTAVNSSGNGVGWQWSIGEPTQNFMTWISNGITGALIFPDQVDGSTPYKFNTWLTHSTGNLFELANNSTSRVVVTPLSTLIGSPVTSPNFSVPAALEVSNFQDRGKALTVDIKLGASGNNDDYPVYFYSQITNSSAHPTINMEEVSPSGYIGGAHTLLSVQETPKVTNTVSTWPTYAAASTTAGYFNAAPTGGTNGAAMGLQGSVDPTRNWINIGVGSYVEATSDNLAATNIAFSGTVNQVLGTQKAVGGLFEIGSLANIPVIPSSAGVLIDGHDSGAPLIIAQTNGAVQFKVAANSGYAGGGTTFLADDGTYKAASGGGGGTIGTLITNGAPISAGDLVAYGTDYTNTAKATSANVQTALGFVPQTGSANLTNWSALATSSKQDASANLTNWSSLSTNAFVNKSGDTMTGSLLVTALTNSARTPSTFVVSGSDKADTSTGTSAMLAATLSDETGSGAAVFGTGPTITPPLYIGGTSASFPMLTNNGTTLRARLGDNSADAPFTAAGGTFSTITVNSTANLLGGGVVFGTATSLSWSQSATAGTVTMTAPNATGTDKNGGSLNMQAGASTGSGVPGNLIFSTSLYTNSSGSTQNSLTTRSQIVGRPCALTNATATSFQRFTMATNTQAGINIFATVTATDASFNKQCISSDVRVDAVNVNGTITATASETDNTLAANTGTLTIAYTVVDEGSNVLAIRANANSSLTTPTVKIKWVIQSINSDGAITVTPVQL